MISFISSFKIINAVICGAKSEGRPYTKTFFWIAASVAAAIDNPNDIKKLLANGLITFFINGKPVFSNGSKSLYMIF